MTGFNHELRALLEKYDAEISFECAAGCDLNVIYNRRLEVATKDGTLLLRVPGFAVGAHDIVGVSSKPAPVDVLVAALKFYANPDNWAPIETGIGMQDGPAIDYGDTARTALTS